MILKKGKTAHFLIFIFFLFFAGQLAAQLHPIYRFKNVMIPVDLRIGDSILPKGGYDLEFLRVSSPLSYFVRIMKKGKILHFLQGEDFQYDNSSTIPKNPTLKMSKNKDEKTLSIVFESGMYQKDYAKIRAIYHIEYEGD
ncbi:MAG: hypothetical protein NTZ12_11320 [Candidatus Aminicenantes bacterium]|nr:hypothetical protein [Candidatus Aminicenantes bacterium]